MFSATNIVKTAITKSGCIAFDGKGEWRFGNGYARNVVIFGVDNISSSHADNCKNNFLILREGDTFGINVGFDAPEKRFSITFSKGKTEFCLSLSNRDNSYLFINGKNSLSLKPITEASTFQVRFV